MSEEKSTTTQTRFGSRADVPRPSYVSNVTFRNLNQDVAADGSFFQAQDRSVLFDYEFDHEVAKSNPRSKAAIVSILPMALDNDRFFLDDEFGYGDLLAKAAVTLEADAKTGSSWKEASSEMAFMGWLWRFFIRCFLALINDGTNRLRFTRGVQESLPFLTGYESYAVGGVIRAFDLDERGLDRYNLRLAFKNRNASRVLVQNLLARCDLVWHLSTQVTWNRAYDMLGQFPIIGVTSFLPTENFPSTKTHALQAIFRGIFQGSFLTRLLTGNREGLVTLDRHTAAQNLAAEGNGFEEANRNQFGTYFGREMTNAFRVEHRLATDESILRSFMVEPESTMVNNGVEHVLRCLAKHWKNMLFQENGNFAHQRMEQLHPFEILRFHMPVVLVTLSNLRGRNKWDSVVLGPFLYHLQNFHPDKVQRSGNHTDEEAGDDSFDVIKACSAAQKLIDQLDDEIVPNVCAGIATRSQPFREWLDALTLACDELRSEAEDVHIFVNSVKTGIQLGYELLRTVNWHVPTEETMRSAVIAHMRDESLAGVPRECVRNALEKLAPKDMRTLRELIMQGMQGVSAAQLLLGRTTTLLERELRRTALDKRIVELSKGEEISPNSLKIAMWYWVNDGNHWRVCVFTGRSPDRTRLLLTDVDASLAVVYDTASVGLMSYIPIAEAISRAQKAFLTVELDHGKRFSYNAFMEFGAASNKKSLRTMLRRLAVLSQVHCSELDKARLNVLEEVKNAASSKGKESRSFASRHSSCLPQSVIILGGGPTGMLTAIHSTQHVLASGGEVRLYEHRDAFRREASAFERGQIVRLDSRQIALLRYHLGTSYEDVFIPARGETDPHLGNTIPTQGFVEVTVKRLENMLLDEIIRLRSKDLLHYYTDSKVDVDVTTGALKKRGGALKVGDRIQPNGDGKTWEVKSFIYNSSLEPHELIQGGTYDIVSPRDGKVHPYRLERMDARFDWYHFTAQEARAADLAGKAGQLPPIFRSGEGRIDPTSIMIEEGQTEERDFLDFDKVAKTSFDLDVVNCHVLIAYGKPGDSSAHFYVTSEEPYSVCCIEGLKVSKQMHNFGEKRWGVGLWDDFRSISDQNTRVVGDFTKSVALGGIVKKMSEKMIEDTVWCSHFEQLPDRFDETLPSLLRIMQEEVESLAKTDFYRERLQTRFFELGDNYYVGMELPREYNSWKKLAVGRSTPQALPTARLEAKAKRAQLQQAMVRSIDRLWFEATLDVLGEGDVYNPGGNSSVPRFYTIDSTLKQTLGQLDQLDDFCLANETYRVQMNEGSHFTRIKSNDEPAFLVSNKTRVIEHQTRLERNLGELAAGERFEPVDRFEILFKGGGHSVVRNSRGFVGKMPNTIEVRRLSNLSRAPNGYSESKVALASFPTAHVVSHRTLIVNAHTRQGGYDGCITAFVGDAQVSPHFMRYSGLTGATISCMTFNNFVAQALHGVKFQDRIQRYAFETNWSNGEVVQRGTGANYGEDGFLRPAFTYRHLIDYLYAQAQEHREIGSSPEESILSRDWKVKLASALVPRGLENDALFHEAVYGRLELEIGKKFEDEVMKTLGGDELSQEARNAMTKRMSSLTRHWNASGMSSGTTTDESSGSDNDRTILETSEVLESVVNALIQSITFSIDLRSRNQRISSEAANQPKPVDSFLDDFAVEAQNFANSLTQSAAFATGAIALGSLNGRAADFISPLLGVLSIFISFGTMTNVSRYKIRNEEARLLFFDTKMLRILKGVFSLMTQDQRDQFPGEKNPFAEDLGRKVDIFLKKAKYYGLDDAETIPVRAAYAHLMESCNDPLQVISFMRQLVTEFIPSTFHANPYLKDDLVNIYKILHEMLSLTGRKNAAMVDGAGELYHMLLLFRPRLEASIQRGEVRYGFLKERKWYQWSLPVTFQYLFPPLLSKRVGSIALETREIFTKVKRAQSNSERKDSLRREARDLEELYFATTESEIGSMTFLSGLIVFVTSTLFTTFRLLATARPSDSEGDPEEQWVRSLLLITMWASIGSLFGALLAFFHLIRKMKHLLKLDATLGKGKMATDTKVVRVRTITRTQALLTAVRLAANALACVALPWTVYVQTWGDSDTLNEFDTLPVLLAVVAVLMAVGATVFFFLVEFGIRYNLDPCLGQVVCEPFRGEILKLKASFSSKGGCADTDIDTIQSLEAEAWEYTAREFLSSNGYRFDTVFAADRFGSIVQYLQSGKLSELTQSAGKWA